VLENSLFFVFIDFNMPLEIHGFRCIRCCFLDIILRGACLYRVVSNKSANLEKVMLNLAFAMFPYSFEVHLEKLQSQIG